MLLQAARINPLATTITEFPANKADVRAEAWCLPPARKNGLFAYDGFDYPRWPAICPERWLWLGRSLVRSGSRRRGRLPTPTAFRSRQPGGRGRSFPRGIMLLSQTEQRNRIRRSLGTVRRCRIRCCRPGRKSRRRSARRARWQSKFTSASCSVSPRVDDGFYGLELHRGDGNGNRVLCIGNGAEGAGYGATSNVNVYGPRRIIPLSGVEDLEVELFCGQDIVWGLSNKDIVERSTGIPESLRDESACTVDAVLQGNFAFDRISMGCFDGEKIHEIDELRVGTHFLAVTGRWGGDRGGRTSSTQELLFNHSR